MTQQNDPGQPPAEDQFRIEQLGTWANAVPTNRGKLFGVAAVVLALTLGVGGVWASTAKLGGAVVGGGRVIATGNNKVLQHLEGGILKGIAVKEGDKVERDQVLATMDTTAITSQRDAVQIQRATMDIELERWRAASLGAESFDIDLARLDPVADAPRVVDALESQKAEFQATLNLVKKQLSILDSKIASEKEDISGINASIDSYIKQRELIEQEHKGLASLLDKGLTSQTRVLTLERTMAQLESQRLVAEFTIAKSHSNIKTFTEEKEKLLLQYNEQANEGLTRTQRELNRLEDIEARVSDQLKRASIRSPITGIVFRLYKKTEGAVLGAGETFAEIFPEGEPLSIETIVATKDISQVYIGQDVSIVFQSDHRASLVPAKGEVRYISADTVVNADTGAANYIVNVAVDVAESAGRVVPGNTAEVFFRTEPKTLVQMLVEPISRFAFRTFTG